MDLKTYIELKNIKKKDFAEIVGISTSALSNYLHYRRTPTLEIGRRIEKITKGKVTIDELINYWKDKKDHG